MKSGNRALVVAISRPDSSDHSTEEASLNDSYDRHNRPRERRTLILDALRERYGDVVRVEHPRESESLQIYADYQVHDPKMVEFICTAWKKWEALGVGGRDTGNFHPRFIVTEETKRLGIIPPMVPCNMTLHRDEFERLSDSVMGQVGYYCTDFVTPIVGTLLEELQWDRAVVSLAVDESMAEDLVSDQISVDPCHGRAVAYAITTHPGHHSSFSSYGGYCYVNHAALAAVIYQVKFSKNKVAILDVDYHCGNGTASIFYKDPSVLTISIHCDPNVEYPFHSGYADQTGTGDGEGATLHIPLPPHTSWEPVYRDALHRAMVAIQEYGAEALVVSLGLDTHDGDQVATRRAGFHLKGQDYKDMGFMIGSMAPSNIPICVIQEGGYLMEVVGPTAADVVAGMVTCLSNRIDHQPSRGDVAKRKI